MDVFYKKWNIAFDKRISMENDKSFIYSDYKVALVTVYWVRTVIETNKFACYR